MSRKGDDFSYLECYAQILPRPQRLMRSLLPFKPWS